MDLKAKIDELVRQMADKAIQQQTLHHEIKEIRKKISKYETVLKHAEEIEQLNEPVGENTVL